MGDFAVDRWKLDGRLYLWHYPEQVRDFEGWHLNADASAFQSVARLIDLMFEAKWKTRKRIPIAAPKRMTTSGGALREPAAWLLLDYRQREIGPDYWILDVVAEPSGKIVNLSLGESKLRKLQRSLLKLPNWKDDFAIGPEVDWSRTNNRKERARFLQGCLWLWTKIE